MYFMFQLNFALALLGLALAAVTVALVVDLVAFKGRYGTRFFSTQALPITIAVAVGSTALSLLYSEYFGFIPCSLCWLQRIAIYPQALLSIMAVYIADQRYFPRYGIGLSLFGLAVAIYQYLYQMLPQESIASGLMPCLADGSNADCAVKVINEFGFVTFPLLSAITFAFLIAVYFYALRGETTQNASAPERL